MEKCHYINFLRISLNRLFQFLGILLFYLKVFLFILLYVYPGQFSNY